MKHKFKILIIPVTAVLLLLGYMVFSSLNPYEFRVKENEIGLIIQLDTEEDMGLLLIDYAVNGKAASGGISNADKTLIKKDETLYFTIPEQAFDTLSDQADLILNFSIVKNWYEPNYDNIYPKEDIYSLDPTRLNARMGQTYHFKITGDFNQGFQLSLE